MTKELKVGVRVRLKPALVAFEEDLCGDVGVVSDVIVDDYNTWVVTLDCAPNTSIIVSDGNEMDVIDD